MDSKPHIIFKALADPNRLKILAALKHKCLCVCEIRSLLGLANSTVSQHLRILKESGFLSEERDGKWMNYKLNPRPEDPRISAIISTLDFWAARTPDKEFAERIATLNREKICGV